MYIGEKREGCPYFRGVLISGYPYYRGVLISGCPYFRGVLISGYPYFRVSLFQGYPHFRGINISRMPIRYTRQKKRNANKNSHFNGFPLDLCRKCIAALFRDFCQRAIIFANALHFHGKSTAIQGLRHFTRRHTFRDSVKVRHTQRDKHVARYAALISAAAAR